MILLDINGACAAIRKQEVLTAGRVGAVAKFVFDERWEGVAKTAVFRAGEITKDAVISDSVAKIPHEVLVEGVPLEVGVYGTKDDGAIVIPTVWAKTNPVKAGVDPSGDESADPSLPFWAEVQEAVERELNGIYLGSGDMPDNYNVQIDPNGDSLTVEDIEAVIQEELEEALADIGGGEYEATPNTLADVISKAQPNSTIRLSDGTYPRLDLVGASAYPKGLTITGGTDAKVAGISITSGLIDPIFMSGENPQMQMPGDLTFKGFTLTNSLCLRNCAIDGLNILNCNFNQKSSIQLAPDSLVDKYGRDTTKTSTTVWHWGSVKHHIRNVVIDGNIIRGAATDASDTTTTAIRISCVNNLQITNNEIKEAAHCGVLINGQSGYNSTGRIVILKNIIRKSGAESIRLAAVNDALVFVHSNDLRYANQTKSSASCVYVSDCEDTEFTWALSSTSGQNSYRDDSGLRKISVGDGIALEKVKYPLEDHIAEAHKEIGNRADAYPVEPDGVIKGRYKSETFEQVYREDCTLYYFWSDAYHTNTFDKPIKIRTYMHGNMAITAVNSSAEERVVATNADADIKTKPESGIFEYTFTFTDFWGEDLYVSFCENDYLEKPEFYIEVGSVWQEIGKIGNRAGVISSGYFRVGTRGNCYYRKWSDGTAELVIPYHKEFSSPEEVEEWIELPFFMSYRSISFSDGFCTTHTVDTSWSEEAYVVLTIEDGPDEGGVMNGTIFVIGDWIG